MLVRSWNLFHGNTLPPGRRSRLEQMVRLATEDRPDVLCLQEVPLWALSRLPGWSGMSVRHVVTRRALLGDVARGRDHAAATTGSSAPRLPGQANAILLAPGLEALAHRTLRIDERRAEPRFCHAVRLEGLVIGNLHATNDFRRPEVPAAEILRGEAFVTGFAGALPCVLAGDFNLRAEHMPELPGWSAVGPGIDHVLVRRLSASPLSGVAGRATASQWRGAVGPCPGRGDDRMTPEEARALFPVLERLAYLNAGTFGPIAQPTADADSGPARRGAGAGTLREGVLRADARVAGGGSGGARVARRRAGRSTCR